MKKHKGPVSLISDLESIEENGDDSDINESHDVMGYYNDQENAAEAERQDGYGMGPSPHEISKQLASMDSKYSKCADL